MKHIIATSCVFIASIILAACSDQVSVETSSADSAAVGMGSSASQVNTAEPAIPNRPVRGRIKGQPFLIGRAVLKNGKLELRQGDDFFADRDITITLGQEGVRANQTITVADGSGFGAPKISISYNLEGNNLPETEYISSAYRMQLEFGTPTEVGIPFGIDLLIPDSVQTQAKGRFFAAFTDILVVDGNVDLSLDTFDTLRFVGQTWLKQNRPEQLPLLGDDFGVSIQSFGDPAYLKTGFIGFEMADAGSNVSPVKLQLLKDEEGWHIINVLKESEISPAHPVDVGEVLNERRASSRSAAELAASLELERELNASGIMPSVRYTNMACRIGGKSGRASCRATYSVKEAEATSCKTSNWLLGLEQDTWTVLQKIKDTQRANSKTGELEDYKPFSVHCG